MIKPKEALAPTLRAQHVHRQPSIPKRRRAAASQTRAKTQRGGTACQSRAHRFIAVGGQVTFASPHGLLPCDLHGEEKRQWRRERGGHERLELGGSGGRNTTKHNHARRHDYRRGGWCCPLPPRLEASHRHRGRRRRPNRSSPMAVRRSAGGARQPHWRKRAKVRRRDQRQGGVSTPRSWRRAKSLLACRSGGCWVAAGGDGARICSTLRSWQPCSVCCECSMPLPVPRPHSTVRIAAAARGGRANAGCHSHLLPSMCLRETPNRRPAAFASRSAGRWSRALVMGLLGVETMALVAWGGGTVSWARRERLPGCREGTQNCDLDGLAVREQNHQRTRCYGVLS